MTDREQTRLHMGNSESSWRPGVLVSRQPTGVRAAEAGALDQAAESASRAARRAALKKYRKFSLTLVITGNPDSDLTATVHPPHTAAPAHPGG